MSKIKLQIQNSCNIFYKNSSQVIQPYPFQSNCFDKLSNFSFGICISLKSFFTYNCLIILYGLYLFVRIALMIFLDQIAKDEFYFERQQFLPQQSILPLQFQSIIPIDYPLIMLILHSCHDLTEYIYHCMSLLLSKFILQIELSRGCLNFYLKQRTFTM
ncbi:unnamed protein product (macronuclear) [Paramecium tetraurelia]|uniref:Transmembrane protein n=1 Tax=Paramecium tetraurelia TaxID=5888 RepID=A0CFR3_PARTE|nr:uncharacterized protein GSPATT00038071001 [Paramecium tetraurelia]CAK69630.1 unnamed protein product [Paramecium tetraurelia]|eukprot:XP_001437027.1 hypothetical protein (macronuclear) [Paramecium tetraurelia strain d4-2]